MAYLMARPLLRCSRYTPKSASANRPRGEGVRTPHRRLRLPGVLKPRACESSSASTQRNAAIPSRLMRRLVRRAHIRASLENRSEFVSAFVGSISVVPGDPRLDVQLRTLPAVGSLMPANSTCQMVAGARYVPVPIEMKPLTRGAESLRKACGPEHAEQVVDEARHLIVRSMNVGGRSISAGDLFQDIV